MSNSANLIVLLGRVTKDIELKQTQSGVAVARFTIAVNRPKRKDGTEVTDFIDCQAWRQQAEFISKYFSKGTPIFVIGSLQRDNYTDKEGKNATYTYVLVDNVSFVPRDSGNNNSNTNCNNQQNGSTNNYNSVTNQQQPTNLDNLDGFEELMGDGDVPF